MLPTEVFATTINIFDLQNVCLIVSSKARDRLIFYGSEPRISRFFDFLSLEVTLVPWLALKKGFDRLIQFAKLLHGTVIYTLTWLLTVLV